MDPRRKQLRNRLRIAIPITILIYLPIMFNETLMTPLLDELPLRQFGIVMAAWVLLAAATLVVCAYNLIKLGDLREEHVAKEREAKEKISTR